MSMTTIVSAVISSLAPSVFDQNSLQAPGAHISAVHPADDPHRGAALQAGVFLVLRDRRAPERHHGVADELVHDPARPGYRLGGVAEVGVEQVDEVVFVELLGE